MTTKIRTNDPIVVNRLENPNASARAYHDAKAGEGAGKLAGADVEEQRAADNNEVSKELLDDVHAFLGRFVIYPSEHAKVAHTLWVAHTHLMDEWESTPRLAFLSPERECGKTRALEITVLLVPRPVMSYNNTPAYLFRKIGDSAGLPTILYDELDTVFGDKAKGDSEGLRGLFNAGHRRGAAAGRCVTRGDKIETEDFPAYCALALSGIGNLPDTILSRSVIVRMRRRRRDEDVEAFRTREHTPEGHPLRDKLAAWADTVRTEISKARPKMPDGIEDRSADVWEPLLAIADEVGGHWPERARVAAVALVALSKEDGGGSLGTRLLHDLRPMFENEEKHHTSSIINYLINREEAPWSSIKGKQIDSKMLADYLNPYGVFSKDVRIGNTVKKGYYKKDLHDAFERYLTPLPSPQEGLQELQPLPSSISEKETRETEETTDLVAGFSEWLRVREA
jgi:hypothetical protein